MHDQPAHRRPLLIGIGILLLFVAAGIAAIRAFVNHERQRDLESWQVTLGVMADSRANDIERFVDSQIRVLRELSQNGSLQLYTQQILERREMDDETEAALLSYLRNLILSTAEREGFTDSGRAVMAIPANIAVHADAALLLVDRRAAVIAATPGITSLPAGLQEAMARTLQSGRSSVYGIFLNENNQPIVGFLVPVFAMPEQGGQARTIAVLAGLKDARETLFPLLAARGETTQTDEALLVQRQGDMIVYVSPLKDGAAALQRRLAANAADLVAAAAVRHPGAFIIMRDYAGREVLATSRAFPDLPWILIQKINAAEALRESNVHQRFLSVSLLLFLLLVSALLVAAWSYGSSIREQKLSRALLAKSQQLESQTRLLQAVNDNIADYIFLIDFEKRLIFANGILARQLGVSAEDVRGKTLSSLFGTETAARIKPFILAAQDTGAPVYQSLQLEINARMFHLHATFIPIPYLSERRDAVLVSLHDVTLLQEAQQQQAQLLRQVVKALMRAIDLHDPYSANHSSKTADIAIAIGRAMQIDKADLDTLETAANLCNLGKLSIPKDLLAKTGVLTEKELAILRQEANYAREFLASIEFEGAVVDTIVQKNEYLDGSGYPNGLRDDAIIPTARILAVANAFVAMISPRAYRERLSVEVALGQLLQAADVKYDRHVVAALFHVAENEFDWSMWS